MDKPTDYKHTSKSSGGGGFSHIPTTIVRSGRFYKVVPNAPLALGRMSATHYEPGQPQEKKISNLEQLTFGFYETVRDPDVLARYEGIRIAMIVQYNLRKYIREQLERVQSQLPQNAIHVGNLTNA